MVDPPYIYEKDQMCQQTDLLDKNKKGGKIEGKSFIHKHNNKTKINHLQA